MSLSALRPCILLFALLAGFPSQAADTALTPKFVEETDAAGIDSTYSGEWEYIVGGGAAAFDCDADGFQDLFLAGGEGKAAFYHNTARQGGPLRFAAEPSGLELEHVTGAYPLDVDGDGIIDLILLRVGESVAMRGLGNCRFERANEAWNFDGGDAWSTALSATWERGADWPTVALGTYIDRTQDMFPWGSCTDNRLYRPQAGARRFAAPAALKPSFCALSMLFTDWNRSGTPSLRVSNDREYYKGGQEQMWRVEPGAAPSLYTAAEGWKYLRIWGMGIAAQDLDFDGFPEYFLTSMADNKLQALDAPAAGARPSYADRAFAKGVTAPRPYAGGEVKPSTAWHAEFQDVNNDGLADLFVAKGNVSEMPDFALNDPNNLLVQEPGGTFREMGDAAGVASMRTARGAALADFNLDGLIDLAVVNRHAKAQLWRNATVGAGHWLSVRIEQPGANRDAVGAWIELTCAGVTQRQEVSVGGGHAGGQIGWRHFGLGTETGATLSVLWPDGERSAPMGVEGDRFVIVRRDGAAPETWTPAVR